MSGRRDTTASVAAWYDAHAVRYDRLDQGIDGDIAFYARLGAEARGPVLEIGCGSGRVTRGLAASAPSVTGLDISPGMLDIARGRGGAAIRWVEADMRAFDLPERFDLICIPHRTFLHALARADQEATLACCYRHLRPGGRLALNIFNLPAALMPAGCDTVYGTPRRGLRVRYVRAPEMRRLLTGAGFTVAGVWGGFGGEPFDESSPEQVWLAVRPMGDAGPPAEPATHGGCRAATGP